MENKSKDWFGVLVVIVIGCALLALLGAKKQGYGSSFAHFLTAIVVGTASIVTTVFATKNVGKKFDAEDGGIAAGYLLGMFVVAPIAVTIAFKILKEMLR